MMTTTVLAPIDSMHRAIDLEDALGVFRARVRFALDQLVRLAENEHETQLGGESLPSEGRKVNNDVLFGIADLLSLGLDKLDRQMETLPPKNR